ncbi:hypothetical protein RKE29_16855 [Streptomyces sp. B1866]|uniref:hypothetical protein n=1 Tax=Streptomyces sp. B1866 TaxID=3075431 RepID=UPI00288F9851|nr:hypothetical protein [Streptomyces sp. B1866]MDT3398294.1 hypothetical protein [Streptomyces sp. B1866]
MTAPASGVGRGPLAAVLGLALDQVLAVRPGRLPMLCHPWDAWWVAARSLGRIRPEPGTWGACPACAEVAAAQIVLPLPGHPGHDGRGCGCHRTWAEAMRAPLAEGRLPAVPQRLTLALLKPGAPRRTIRSRLRTALREVHVVDRQLTAADCDRLYPDAYGAEFVAQRTAYLTSGTVEVVVLAGGTDAVACGAALKRTVRADLGVGMLRNHLHMPDNPAEALADIALLAGWDELTRLYRRWESDERRLAARLAGYRAHLERGDGTAGVVGPQRRGHPLQPAPDRR